MPEILTPAGRRPPQPLAIVIVLFLATFTPTASPVDSSNGDAAEPAPADDALGDLLDDAVVRGLDLGDLSPLLRAPGDAEAAEAPAPAAPTAAPYDDGIDEAAVARRVSVRCRTELLPGQFRCAPPDVDPDTQQPAGCKRVDDDGRAIAPNAIKCQALPGLLCLETGTANFSRDASCQWTNGYDFETAVVLSVFLGCFGADRFYLGYPALGLLKLSTLGFFFLGHLLDILLIASQTVGPADGSAYVISYFGPGVRVVGMDNETDRRPQPDWYT